MVVASLRRIEGFNATIFRFVFVMVLNFIFAADDGQVRHKPPL